MLDGVIRKAPASAVKALHQFQPLGTDEKYRVLWIDAICINQADIAERADQVQMMGEIYRRCESCLVWLGDHDESVTSAMSSLKLILDDMTKRTSKYRGNILEAFKARAWDFNRENDDPYSQAFAATPLDEKALSMFLWRPWFGRLWVRRLANSIVGYYIC